MCVSRTPLQYRTLWSLRRTLNFNIQYPARNIQPIKVLNRLRRHGFGHWILRVGYWMLPTGSAQTLDAKRPANLQRTPVGREDGGLGAWYGVHPAASAPKGHVFPRPSGGEG